MSTTMTEGGDELPNAGTGRCFLQLAPSRPQRLHGLCLAFLQVLLILPFAPLTAHAATSPSALQHRSSSAPPLRVPSLDRIRQTLEQEGTARIIVRLVPPAGFGQFRIEGELSDHGTVGLQRAAIAHQQEKVAVSTLSAEHRQAAKRYDFIPFMAAEVDPAEFEALLASPDLDLMEEDLPVPPTLMQSVPLIGGSGGAFGGFTGSGWTVAILDTGVDKTHPFLAGKVVSEACYSTTSKFGDATAVCTSGSTAPDSGLNCSTSIEGCEHGTHVAGIAAGKGSTFTGVAKDASIIAIQIFSKFQASKCGTGATGPCVMSYTSDQISGLQRVYALKDSFSISSVNMSLGGGSYSSYCDYDANYTSEKAAIDSLRSVGIATTIASGNEYYTSSISAPACISSAVSVGATDKSDVVASYSNSAAILNLLAPGSSIYSSLPAGSYAYYSGTSMATPHVAGAWAVLKQAKPSATVTEVLSALSSTGKSVTDSRNGIVKPRIKVDAAVSYLRPPPPTYSVAVTKGGSGSGTVTTDQTVGITCGSSCSARVVEGTSVSLMSIPATGSTFTGWTGGGCSGTANPCVTTIAADTTVQATFAGAMTTASESFAEAVPPPGWTVVNNIPGGNAWRFDNPGSRTNATGGAGGFAVADAQFPQDLATMDTELRSPAFDFRGYTGVALSFRTSFLSLNDSTGDVDISTDGGVTWANIWRKKGSDYTGPAAETIDVTARAAGAADVRFRFRYSTATHGNSWEVDDILVSGSARFSATASVPGGHGTVSSATTTLVEGGQPASFTLQPDVGYTPADSVAGTCPPGSFSGSTYTTGALAGNCSVVFSFVPLKMSISTAVSGSGSIACTPGTTVDYGTVTSCTATPDSGHYIATAVIDTTPQAIPDPAGFTYLFGPVTSGHTFSASFTPFSVPGPPVNVIAGAGSGSATVSFNPPLSTGGTTITGYSVLSFPGNITATGTSAPITVYGLVNGTSYTFTVTATNSLGGGPASTPSNSVTPTIGPQSLSVSVSGAGSGTIRSTPAGISCSNGGSSGCTSSFAGNSIVSLAATPDWDSIFTGWSSDCTGTACTVSMDGSRSVQAMFALKQNVALDSSTYSSVQSAYNAAASGEMIQLAADTFVENLSFARPVEVTLQGGLDSSFTSVTGLSAIKGSLTVIDGSVTIDGILIQ